MYAVGIAASRITIADQQRRAVNLIWALLREGRVMAGSRIAIVGGGLSGATAAVYALSQHLRVTVFEKFDDTFSLQQGSGRWIHPNVYDWPADGWRNDETNLRYGVFILSHLLYDSDKDASSDSASVHVSLRRGLLRYNGCVRGTNTRNCFRYPEIVRTRIDTLAISQCGYRGYDRCVAEPMKHALDD